MIMRSCLAALLLSVSALVSLPVAAQPVVDSAATVAVDGDTGAAPLPLLQDEVLASSAQHFPGILKSLAEQRIALGRTQEVEGAFDTVFSADANSRAEGFYDGRYVDGTIKRPFREFGGNVYGGYGISRGDFPIYEDENFTAEDGSLKLGVLFSLLRDRAIDPRRANIVDAQLGLEQADLELMLTRVGVQQRALRAYWSWVAAGHQLAVYNELLQLALDREEGLRQQVRNGSRAAIFITENAQNITRRRSLALNAQRDFRAAAFSLSFFLRDGAGETMVPSASRLPGLDKIRSVPMPDSGGAVDRSLALRPELLIIDAALGRAQQKIALSENELKPRLDLNLEYKSGLGDDGEGGPSKSSEDLMVGFTFEVPLERRRAKGRLAQARAKREALEFERQRLEDQIELELQNILLDLDVARELAALAKLEVEQAQTMRNAERKRFDSGASDFFLVNLREEAEANARIRYFAAQREAHVARANYDAATVNIAELGISP